MGDMSKKDGAIGNLDVDLINQDGYSLPMMIGETQIQVGRSQETWAHDAYLCECCAEAPVDQGVLCKACVAIYEPESDEPDTIENLGLYGSWP